MEVETAQRSSSGADNGCGGSQTSFYNPVDDDENASPSSDDVTHVEKVRQPSSAFEKIKEDIARSSLTNDNLFSSLLEVYVDNLKVQSKHKRNLKVWFFIVLMFLLVGVTVVSLIMMGLAISAGDIASSVSAAVASLVEFSVAFFKLPQIVAEYLFNKSEDDTMASIIKNMQDYNLKRYNSETDVSKNDDQEIDI